MPPIRELSPDALPDGATGIDAHLPGYAKILLRVLAISGYGLWIWLGMGLALGMEQIGRCDMRMPSILGTAWRGQRQGCAQRAAGALRGGDLRHMCCHAPRCC